MEPHLARIADRESHPPYPPLFRILVVSPARAGCVRRFEALRSFRLSLLSGTSRVANRSNSLHQTRQQ